MQVKNLEFSYRENRVLKGIDFSIKQGKITAFIGANGCGKSTLFNVMTKNLRPKAGNVYLDNTDIEALSLKDFARKAAIVHQYNTAPRDLEVRQLVGYGRLPHRRLYRRDDEEDNCCIASAMEITNISHIAQKPMGTLSGGERQRVWIAMALAQNTDILFLDEPTTYLDIRYQVEILHLIKKLNENYGKTIIMILHDINQAMFYSHEVIAMKEGRIVDSGNPDKIITKRLIKEIYEIELAIQETEMGRQVIIR